MKLYNYWRSSASWRVRIALAFKSIPYDYIAVNLGSGAHLEPDYQKVNPFAQAPTLEVEGVRLGQSLAVIEYLEECFPTPTLLPGTPLQRARMRQIAEVVNSGIHPLQNLHVGKKLAHDFQASEAAQKQWRMDVINKGFAGLETLLAQTAGAFCVGDAFSLADCCVAPQVLNARRFDVDLSPYPTILRMEKAALSHPAVIASHPDRQPDTPTKA
jgi:maleylacetoacetate isomerase